MIIHEIERQNRDIFVAILIGLLIGLTQQVSFNDGLSLSQDNIIFLVVIGIIYLVIGVSSTSVINALFNQVCVTLGIIIYEVIFSMLHISICNEMKLLGVVPVAFVIVYGLYKELNHNLKNTSLEITFSISSVLMLSVINHWLGLISSITLLLVQVHIVNTK